MSRPRRPRIYRPTRPVFGASSRNFRTWSRTRRSEGASRRIAAEIDRKSAASRAIVATPSRAVKNRQKRQRLTATHRLRCNGSREGQKPERAEQSSMLGPAVSLWHKIFGSPADQSAKIEEISSRSDEQEDSSDAA